MTSNPAAWYASAIATGEASTCEVAATNNTFSDADVAPDTTVGQHLRITGADGATVDGDHASPGPVTLGKKVDGDPQPVAQLVDHHAAVEMRQPLVDVQRRDAQLLNHGGFLNAVAPTDRARSAAR
jgi:hypothetical protein